MDKEANELIEKMIAEFKESGPEQKHYGYWQLCPKCDGEGQVPNNGTSTSVYRICPVCNGAKLLVRPGVPTHWREKQNKEV